MSVDQSESVIYTTDEEYEKKRREYIDHDITIPRSVSTESSLLNGGISGRWSQNEKDNQNLTDDISAETHNVLSNEAKQYNLGKIYCTNSYKDGQNQPYIDKTGGTGTLIDGRLVLTCAHIFNVVFENKFDIKLEPNQDPGIQLESDQEKKYFVSHISENSPYNSNLQIGDIIRKVKCQDIITQQWGNFPISFLDTSFQKFLNLKVEAERRLVCFCFDVLTTQSINEFAHI